MGREMRKLVMGIEEQNHIQKTEERWRDGRQLTLWLFWGWKCMESRMRERGKGGGYAENLNLSDPESGGGARCHNTCLFL